MSARTSAHPHHDPISPVLISLPNGLDLGGVTTWAVRMANGLAERGRSVSLIAHPTPPCQALAEVKLHAKVRVIDASARAAPGRGSMHNLAGDLASLLPMYRDTIERLAMVHRAPVVYLPNILGDSYGLGAALCATHPELLRVLAWQHTDSDYDTAILARYERVIAGFIAIDERYVATLGSRFPGRSLDIQYVPHGVPVPAHTIQSREPLRPASMGAGRLIRLLYTGRIEHQQKRIKALVFLADALQRRGIAHELTVVGDGPAASEFDALLRTRPTVRRAPAVSPERLASFYEQADAFVLASRYEGLCISRIEAAAHGCVPIITHANSGAAKGLERGVSAEFVDAPPEADELATAGFLADAVERFVSRGDEAITAMRIAAWESTRRCFSIDKHLDEVERVIDRVAASPARFWPSSMAPAFSSSGGLGAEAGASGSGSLGPNAAESLRRTLASIASRLETEGRAARGGVVIHGAGQHTIELASVLARSPVPIVALTDDDAARHGQTLLGWTILPPSRAGSAEGATGRACDVVISSYIHADTIWSRRADYESQGLRVHHLYRQQAVDMDAPGPVEHNSPRPRASVHV